MCRSLVVCAPIVRRGAETGAVGVLDVRWGGVGWRHHGIDGRRALSGLMIRPARVSWQAAIGYDRRPFTPSWFAVRTRARAEKAVYDQLQRKEIEAFLPTVTKWSRWKDRKKQVDWPLFPGYCFVRFDPSTSLSILTCVGVASIVAFGSELASIPDVEIQS